jgi:hypothetical protein
MLHNAFKIIKKTIFLQNDKTLKCLKYVAATYKQKEKLFLKWKKPTRNEKSISKANLFVFHCLFVFILIPD